MNIDLGTFSWDISKIEKQIIENRRQIEGFTTALNLNKKALEMEKKEIQGLSVKMAFINEAQKNLTEELEQGAITQEVYNKQTQENTQALSELDAKGKEIAKSQSAHIKTIIDQENAIKKLRNENADLNKLFEAGRTEVQENQGVYKDLNKELNALKSEAKDLGAQLIVLKREGKESTEEYVQLEQKFKDVSAQADELNEDFKKVDKAVGDNQRSVGDYKNQIVSASSEIMEGLREIASGNIANGVQAISGSFGGLQTAFRALTTTMLSNPITAILVGITAVATGIGLAVKEVFDYNNVLFESNKLTQQITKLQGDMLDEITIRSQAMEQVLGLDRKEVLESAKAVVNEFGISYSEALKIIEEGAIRGGLANNEYLESLREYPTFFAKAGFSAQEFANVINAGYDLGIFNDKLPDALKEFDLSMREQTKATRDALVNAFGASFSDDLLNRVSEGKTTVKEALIEINEESEKYNLTQKQQAQLTADIFRGAGEDVGGFANIMEAVTISMSEQNKELTEEQKIIKEQLNNYNELGEAKNEALKSDAILAFKRDMENLWNFIKVQFYNALSGITAYVKKIGVEFSIVGKQFGAFPGQVRRIFSALGKDFQNIIEATMQLGRALKSALSLNFDEAGKYFDQMKNSLSNAFKNTKQEMDSLKKENRNIRQNAYDNFEKEQKAKAEAQRALEERRKKAQEENGKPTNNFDGSADAKKEKKKEKKDDTQKRLEEEAKRKIELQKEVAEQSIKTAKYELAEYIRINAEKYKDDKRLTDSKLQDQINYFNEVKRRQLELLALEEKTKIEAVKHKEDEINKKKSLTENDRQELQNLANERKLIETEYQGGREKINDETNKKIADTQKVHENKVTEQRKLSKAIEYQQRLLDLETQGASEFEIRQVQLDQETQQRLDALAKENELKLDFDNDNYISQQEILTARKELENEIKLTDDENEKLRLQNQLDQLNIIEQEHAENSKKIIEDVDNFKLQSRSQVLAGLSNLFGRESGLGKIFAAAQITNDTVTNASKAFNQGAVFAANPLTAPLAANAYIQGGIIIASGAAQLAKLVSPKAKAQRGMLIKGNSHAMGGVPVLTPDGMIEAEGGEVIINKVSSMMFKDLLSDINVAGGGVKFARGGIVGANISGVQRTLEYKPSETHLSDEAINRIAEAIYSGSQSGISNLNENLTISNNANF